MDDWKRDQEQDRRETETFRRMHRLIKRGYRLDTAYTAVEDAFWLEHLGGGPRLILYPSGMVVAINEGAILSPKRKHDQDRIFNLELNDAKDFDHWLRGVRLPSWKERTAAVREKYIWQPGCLILMLVACFGVSKLIEAGWKALTGS